MSKNRREAAESAEGAVLRMARAELLVNGEKKITNIWIFFLRYETMRLAVMTGVMTCYQIIIT